MENDTKYEELKRICLGYTSQIVELRLNLLAIETCLTEKGLISSDDLARASEKVHQESKKALGAFGKANRDKQN